LEDGSQLLREGCAYENTKMYIGDGLKKIMYGGRGKGNIRSWVFNLLTVSRRRQFPPGSVDGTKCGWNPSQT